MLYSLRMHTVNKQLQDLVYFPRIKTTFMQLTQRLHLQYNPQASSTFLPCEFYLKRQFFRRVSLHVATDALVYGSLDIDP